MPAQVERATLDQRFEHPAIEQLCADTCTKVSESLEVTTYSRTAMISSADLVPTPRIAPRPKRIAPSVTVNFTRLRFTSGGRTRIRISRSAAMFL